mmetsp:Transcript_17995/g.41613  ORF Transcript_17995/g.41613 Transcript_17995/m.41613 type:complete len:371 (-) Transcript_17995:1361-2473(-)
MKQHRRAFSKRIQGTPKKPATEETQKVVPTTTSKSLAVKEFVAERSNPKPDVPKNNIDKQMNDEHATSVDGYTPKSTLSPLGESKDDGTESWTFDSLSQLMERAGTLPNHNDDMSNIAPQSVVEADISFSVMSAQEYQEKDNHHDNNQNQQDEPLEQPEHVFRGRHDIFQNDNDDDDDDASDDWSDYQFSSDDNGDDEALMDPFHNDDFVEESIPPPEPRAFMELWQALTQWMTPRAVEMITMNTNDGQNPITPAEEVDDEFCASRCAGVMAMMQMHLAKTFRELHVAPERELPAKRRLVEFLQCLSYSRPTPKLSTRMVRALCIVLLHIVMHLDPLEKLPPSIVAVGMQKEEYRYLTQSAIATFAQGSG